MVELVTKEEEEESGAERSGRSQSVAVEDTVDELLLRR